MIDGGHRRDVMIKKTNENSLLRKNIEDAIRNSLDPLSAKRALDSLHPVLKDLSVTDARLLQNAGNRDRQQPSLNQIREKEKEYHSRRKHDQRVTLPSIQSILSDYRKKSPAVNLPAVPILRSVSEPIRVVEMFPRQNVLLNTLGSECSTSRSQLQMQSSRNVPQDHYLKPKEVTYNADAAVSLLRLERITRRPDFSAFWDWKMKNTANLNNGNSGESSKKSAKNPLSKDQLEREIAIYMGNVQDSTGGKRKESKVQRVKRMKEAYSSRPLDQRVLNNSEDVHDDSSVNSVRTAQSMSAASAGNNNSPTVGMDTQYLRHKGNITDSDMITISKYFIVTDDLMQPASPSNRAQSPSLMEMQTEKRISSRGRNMTKKNETNSSNKSHTDLKKVAKSNNNNQYLMNPTKISPVSEYNNSDVLYQMDNTIIQRDINNNDDKDFNYPFPYYSFSPTNSQPASPKHIIPNITGGSKMNFVKKKSDALSSITNNYNKSTLR